MRTQPLRESRKIKGRFVSATADSITLVLKDGQRAPCTRQDVRKVLDLASGQAKRKPGWIALAGCVLRLRS